MGKTSTGIAFPGLSTTSDGAGCVAWAETNISQGACAYPITSSTTMAHGFEEAYANGQQNLWGERLAFIEPESEHSAASACEGFALAGGRVTTFTSGQGLVLMKEVLYTISGKRLPVVFHIGARALTSQSLNVHCGHDDVYAVLDCGWGILFGRNAQEAADLALIARRAAEDSQTPFMHVLDGFLVTHTVENVRLPELDLMREYIGPPDAKLTNLMDPYHPVMTGVVQNQDSYMKGRIAQRWYYDLVKPKLVAAMDEYSRLTGREYGLLRRYRMDDAEYAIVALGSLAETAEVVADYCREHLGQRVGVVHPTCLRPFPGPELVAALADVRAVSVLERTDEPLSQSNPLTRELKSSFADAMIGSEGYLAIDRIPVIYSGSAGLGSRDVRPGDIMACVDNMLGGDQAKRYFTLGIQHPLALARTMDPDIRPPGSFSMRGHSVGGYGSITTNKVIATIVGDLEGTYVQAYPKYGSEKKGLPTTFYLTVAPEPIRSHFEMNHVEFVPLNDVNAFNNGNPLAGIQTNGQVFIQTYHTDAAGVWRGIPEAAEQVIREKHIRIWALDTQKIAAEVSRSEDLVMRMQGIVLLGIFLRVAPFLSQRGISYEQLLENVEQTLRKYFGKRGEQVVQDNLNCARRGYEEVFEVPRALIESSAASVAAGD